jgi:hypothetical protein
MNSRGEYLMPASNHNRQDSFMLDAPESVLPLTHPERNMSMLNLHSLKPLHNLKLRLLLLSIAAFLVFAGPAVTLQGPSKALVAETPNGLLLSTSSLAPVAVGRVDTVDCTAVVGRLDMPGQYVDIYINGVFKITIPADRCSVTGGDCNGFRYTIPSTLKNGKQLYV